MRNLITLSTVQDEIVLGEETDARNVDNCCLTADF